MSKSSKNATSFDVYKKDYNCENTEGVVIEW